MAIYSRLCQHKKIQSIQYDETKSRFQNKYGFLNYLERYFHLTIIRNTFRILFALSYNRASEMLVFFNIHAKCT